jgi:hypothetical protein
MPSHRSYTTSRGTIVRRLVALADPERTRSAFAFEAKRLGVYGDVSTCGCIGSEALRSTLPPERRGPKRGSVPVSSDKRVIIHAAIERFYSRRAALRISDLVDEVAARCLAVGLKPPSRGTLGRHLALFNQRRLVQRREGRAAAEEESDITYGLVETQRPLQRVQIDHTLADVFVVEPPSTDGEVLIATIRFNPLPAPSHARARHPDEIRRISTGQTKCRRPRDRIMQPAATCRCRSPRRE